MWASYTGLVHSAQGSASQVLVKGKKKEMKDRNSMRLQNLAALVFVVSPSRRSHNTLSFLQCASSPQQHPLSSPAASIPHHSPPSPAAHSCCHGTAVAYRPHRDELLRCSRVFRRCNICSLSKQPSLPADAADWVMQFSLPLLLPLKMNLLRGGRPAGAWEVVLQHSESFP